MLDWSENLEDFKMGETVTTFAAALIAEVAEDKKEEFVDALFQVCDYELEFLQSYSIHLIDLLSGLDTDTPTELEVDDLVDYTLQHMGINVNN